MFQRTKICSGLLLAFGSSLLAVAPGAFAQDTTVQRVEITGSSIKRVDAETSEPVTVIKADDLKKQGVTTVEQIMQNVSAMQVQQTSAQAVGAGTGGGSFADLRGLGANKTLVLLNGRRIASSAFDSSAPDINLIPFAAIERVEVLRDGASALYGTDAISGVINFITRKDYRGGTLTLGVDAPQHPGGAAHSANGGFGFGDYDKDGFNFFGFANFDQQAAITSNQRPYYQQQYLKNHTYAPSGTTFPATWEGATNVSANDAATPFGGPACLNSQNLFHSSTQAPNQCGEITSNFIQFVPATQKISGLINAAFKINENNKFNLEAFVAQSKVNAQTAPVPYGALYMHPTDQYFPGNGITPLPAGTVISPDQSGHPGAVNDDALFIKFRTVMLGNREDDNTATQGRFSASLEGNIADWDYNAAVTLNTNHVQDYLKSGYSDINDLATKDTNPNSVTYGGYYLNPAINPFGAQTAAGTAILNAAAAAGTGVLQSGTGTVKEVDGHASRDLGDWLHAGRPAAIALGLDFRNEKFTQAANAPVAEAVIASTGLDPNTLNTGKRDIYAGFFELNVPVIKSLDVTVAGRYDKYSDFGKTFNPKASFRFEPSKSFLLRGSYSTGFRAPSLYELNAAQTYGNSSGGQNDPVNCPNGVLKTGAPSSACNNQFEELAGGNTGLKPEKSKNATLGIVLEPFSDFTAEFDFYHITFTNQIATLADSSLFSLTSANLPAYPQYFHYNAAGQLSVDGTQCPGVNCGYVSDQNQNLGGVKTDGLDTQFNYRFNAGKLGKFNAGLQSTYVHSFKYQDVPGGEFLQNVGVWSGSGPVFRWQHNAVIDWALDPFSLGLAVHYKSGYVDIPNTINPGYKVSAYTTMDLYGSYAMSKGFTFTAGVRNLTDSKAPFTYQTQLFQTGYDPRFADPTGRTYYGRVTYSF